MTVALNRRIFSLVMLLMMYVTLSAQSLYADGDRFSWEANISAGLNNDGYEFGFGMAYFPIQYIGLKANVGWANEIEEISDFLGKFNDDWNQPYEYSTHFYAGRFKFNPSIVLRTPRIIHWKNQDAGFYIFGEPGCVISPGASGSRNARICCWDFKGGINMQIDRLIFFIGYGISNFSLFSGYPDSRWGSPSIDNYITHTGFIGSAYKF